MSYRLIDSNALAMSCPEVNDMPCIYANLPNGLDGNFYVIEHSMKSESARESRWFELFGTPERAAWTLGSILCDYRCDNSFCLECKLHDGCYRACSIVEWLRGDA